MRTTSAVIVALLLVSPAQAGTPDASVPPAPPAPACLSAAQVEERARDVLREPGLLSAAHPYLGPLSPPLPTAWPPSGEPVVRLYAFRSEPLPTGIIAYRDWSPHAAAQIALRGDAPPKLQPLKPRRLGRREDSVEKQAPASIEQATTVLLQSLCRSSLPTGAEAETLRSGYRAWLDAQPLIARELRTHAPSFFTWLESKASGGR
jgi:hypothetical protein